MSIVINGQILVKIKYPPGHTDCVTDERLKTENTNVIANVFLSGLASQPYF